MKRQKCWYANKYKAIRAPKCGCVTCEKKWAEGIAYKSDAQQFFKDLASKQLPKDNIRLDPDQPFDACI